MLEEPAALESITESITAVRSRNPNKARALAREFVRVDCAPLISRLISAVQRRDLEGVILSCQLLETSLLGLGDDVGVTRAVNAAREIEIRSCAYGLRRSINVACQLLKELVPLVDELHSMLNERAWRPWSADTFPPEEIPTEPGKLLRVVGVRSHRPRPSLRCIARAAR